MIHPLAPYRFESVDSAILRTRRGYIYGPLMWAAGDGRGENRDQPPKVDVCLSVDRENGQERHGDMKLVVTGSNGFIGQNTCRRLIDLGHQVIGVDDLSEGSSRRPVDGVQYHVRCVTDTEWLRRLFRETKPSAVIHLAAVPRVSYSVQEPLRSATPNLTGTISVLDAMLKSGLVGESRLVFASSSSVYGGADTLPTPETHPCHPQSPYALTKLQGEQWCRMFHRLYGLDVVSLRYFNVFGTRARFGGAYSTVLPAWLHHLYVDPSYQPYLEGTARRRGTSASSTTWSRPTSPRRCGRVAFPLKC